MRISISPAMRRLVLGAVFALAMASAAGAQDARERTVYVSVADDEGQPVTDISVRDLIVREDGARREILRMSRATDPIDIAILVDDSQAAGPHLVFIRNALTQFVEQMRDANNIAVVGLAQRPTMLTDYTRDPGRLSAAIGRVFPQTGSGMTLLDALVELSRGLEKRPGTRAALVGVLSDGPEQGRFDDQAVIAAMTKAGASFYAATVGRFADIQSHELRSRSIVLSRGTRDTGGRHANTMAASGLPRALRLIGEDLSSQIKVVYARPDSLIQPESISVEAARPGLKARGVPARPETRP